MPDFRAVPFQRVTLCLELSAADESCNIVQMQGAVGVEYIAVLDFDGTSAGPPDGEFRPPGDVLSRIPDPGAQTAHREQGLDAAGGSRLFKQYSAGTGNDYGGTPCGVVESAAVPAGSFKPGVVMLSVAETIECDRSVERDFPGIIACQNGLFPIGEFEQEFRVVAPDRFVEMPDFRRVTVIQSVAEDDAKSVPPVDKQICKVIYEIRGVGVVVCRSGRQFAVSDFVSVEPDFMVSESAKIQFVCFSPPDLKLSAEIRRGEDSAIPVRQIFSE